MIFRRVAALCLVLATAPLASGAEPTGLQFKTGVGYDYFSQQYFMHPDSLSHPGVDTLALWSVTTNYLNDVKGNLALRYVTPNTRRYDLRASYEQSPSILRLRLGGDVKTKLSGAALEWKNEIDWRDQYEEAANPVGNYFYGASQGKLKYPVGDAGAAWAQLFGEGINFYGAQTFHRLDYYRFGGKLGFDRSFGFLSQGAVDLFLTDRRVLDSAALGYANYGLEGSFLGTFASADLDLLARLERKNYRRADHGDNFSRFELDSRSRLQLNPRWFTRHELEVEKTWFGPQDMLNNDYWRVGMTLLTGREFGQLSVSAGPQFEILGEKNVAQSFGEDYLELGGKVDLEVLVAGKLFGSLESTFGHRDLTFRNTLQSNFYYERLNLLGDWTVWQDLSLNMLLSTEWEWHDDHADNSRILLISSGLAYHF